METVTFRGKTYQVGGDPLYRDLPLPPFILALVLPPHWQELDTSAHHWGQGFRDMARAYQYKKGALWVLASCGYHDDGRPWLHVSVSRKDAVIPTWEQMSTVKRIFIGEERQALQVMPRASKHVNLHPGVLHLWCCLEDDGLPDFTAGGQTL